MAMTIKNLRGNGSNLRGNGSNLRGNGSNLRGKGSNLRGKGSNVRGKGSNVFDESRQFRGLMPLARCPAAGDGGIRERCRPARCVWIAGKRERDQRQAGAPMFERCAARRADEELVFCAVDGSTERRALASRPSQRRRRAGGWVPCAAVSRRTDVAAAAAVAGIGPQMRLATVEWIAIAVAVPFALAAIAVVAAFGQITLPGRVQIYRANRATRAAVGRTGKIRFATVAAQIGVAIAMTIVAGTDALPRHARWRQVVARAPLFATPAVFGVGLQVHALGAAHRSATLLTGDQPPIAVHCLEGSGFGHITPELKEKRTCANERRFPKSPSSHLASTRSNSSHVTSPLARCSVVGPADDGSPNLRLAPTADFVPATCHKQIQRVAAAEKGGAGSVRPR